MKERSFPVPIPETMKHLPIDKRGFPIPHNVFIDTDGTPQFKVNDEQKNNLCLMERRCHVCGNPLKGEYWLIGGQLSAFHPNGVFNDGPVHYDCGLFALKVCPYMAYTQYTATTATQEGVDKLAEKLKDKSLGLFNPTQDLKRLSFFCFVQTSNYYLKPYGVPGVYVTLGVRPYKQIEFYRDGNRINKAECIQILKKENEKSFLP